ncbi:MAG: hypothetical protein WCK57_06030 [Verrucomicrobiae bacterium]
MKTLNCQKYIEKSRFVACETASRLLKICVRAAGRVPVSKSGSPVHLSAGYFVHGELSSSSPNNRINLKRCEIFRGKVPLRQTQK